MTNKKFMKKVAPVVMSAAVVMSSMPYAVMAADFTDSEAVVTDSMAEEFASDDAQEEFTAQEPEEFNTDSAAADEVKQGEAYVLMNIPYDDFYKAELKNNDVKVDAFTSATKNKSRTAGMMNGNSAYHVNPDGSDVTGVTFPVKVSDLSTLKDQKQVTDSDSVTITVTNRGQTSSNTYTGKDALIENASYAYYILSEAPSYYKELTVNADGSYSFSAMKGAETKTVTIDATLKTETSYGDYELDLNNETFSEIIDTTTDKIYGVTVNTTDGTNYGLRHLENIWRGSMLSWGTGYTTEVHGCPVSSEHYKSIMGKTIESVTYYTDKGMITFDVPDVKVEITTGIKATVADIMDTDSEAAVTFDQALPSDFQAQYTVDGKEAAYANGKLTTGSLALGTHEVVITDISGTYAPIVTEFTVNTDKLPAAYNIGTGKIVAADDATAEDLVAYIKSISKVKVGETEYAASGRGAKVIVKEDGSLDLTDLQVTEGTVFEVTATGYKNNLVFTYEEAKFSLDVTEKTLYVKGEDTVTLKADTNLSDEIIWTSSNEKVAVVSAKGVVTAKAKGTAVITATCGEYTASCTVTVKSPAVSLNKTKATLYTKGSNKVTLKASLQDLTGYVVFTSSTAKVAAVNKTTGVVTAKAKGTAVITATCGDYTATCTVTVKTPTLKLAKTSASIKVGKKTTIKATATPTGTVKYTSSNKKIATVSSKGVVTGKKKGTAKITVTCNGVSKTFKVTVK